MNDREKLIELYDIYKELFTEKQQKYFESYYIEDLSLSEIGENYKVSRAIVGRTVNNIEKKLYKLESILKVFEKNKLIDTLKNK